MGELTTAINDKEILNHFTDVLAPFVRQNQCIEMRESNSNSPSYSKTKSEAVKEIASMLTASVDGKRSQEVLFVFVALDVKLRLGKMSVSYVICFHIHLLHRLNLQKTHRSKIIILK